MQVPTHLTGGMLVQKAIPQKLARPLRWVLIAVLAFFLHGLWDRLARFAYHPPVLPITDWFQAAFHLAMAGLGLLILIRHGWEYRVAFFFSVLPDLDWVVLHLSSRFSLDVPFWRGPLLHELAFLPVDLLPPIRYLNTLPERTLERSGIVLELALMAACAGMVYVTTRREKQKENAPTS